MKSLWRPIEELEDKYAVGLLLHAPELVDGDCNPEGVAPGYWQDGPLTFGGDEEGEWIAAGYCMCHYHYKNVTCVPTHFMIMEGPEEADACRYCGQGLVQEEADEYTDVCSDCAKREGVGQ